jgi:urease accessory protein
MKNTCRRLLAPLAAFAALPSLALAHPGHDGHDFGWDFSAGLAHPLSGWDHLLAMVAVGLWAAQLGGRARWLVPASFVALMTAGAALGQAGWPIAGSEQAIAASVLVLGLLVAGAVRMPLIASITLVGAFALFHGFAHGTEMPSTAGGLSYGLGFVAMTALLHLAGLGAGSIAARRTSTDRLARIAGAAIACAAVFMVV